MKTTVTLFILGLFAVVVGAATAHVSLRYRMIRTGYEIGERMHEVRVLEEEGRRLRVELALLRSPERIERVAHEKLGMVKPDAGHIRVVHVANEVATRR
jgi:cell division protein FtsL